MLEKTLENPLDCKGIKPVDLKANQPWIFTGGIDAGAKALILWWPNEKNPFTEKTLMLGKLNAEQEEVAEDEIVGWHHWLNGHEFQQTLGDGEGRVAWYATVDGVTESDTT